MSLVTDPTTGMQVYKPDPQTQFLTWLGGFSQALGQANPNSPWSRVGSALGGQTLNMGRGQSFLDARNAGLVQPNKMVAQMTAPQKPAGQQPAAIGMIPGGQPSIPMTPTATISGALGASGGSHNVRPFPRQQPAGLVANQPVVGGPIPISPAITASVPTPPMTVPITNLPGSMFLTPEENIALSNQAMQTAMAPMDIRNSEFAKSLQQSELANTLANSEYSRGLTSVQIPETQAKTAQTQAQTAGMPAEAALAERRVATGEKSAETQSKELGLQMRYGSLRPATEKAADAATIQTAESMAALSVAGSPEAIQNAITKVNIASSAEAKAYDYRQKFDAENGQPPNRESFYEQAIELGEAIAKTMPGYMEDYAKATGTEKDPEALNRINYWNTLGRARGLTLHWLNRGIAFTPENATPWQGLAPGDVFEFRATGSDVLETRRVVVDPTQPNGMSMETVSTRPVTKQSQLNVEQFTPKISGALNDPFIRHESK